MGQSVSYCFADPLSYDVRRLFRQKKQFYILFERNEQELRRCVAILETPSIGFDGIKPRFLPWLVWVTFVLDAGYTTRRRRGQPATDHFQCPFLVDPTSQATAGVVLTIVKLVKLLLAIGCKTKPGAGAGLWGKGGCGGVIKTV